MKLIKHKKLLQLLTNNNKDKIYCVIYNGKNCEIFETTNIYLILIELKNKYKKTIDDFLFRKEDDYVYFLKNKWILFSSKHLATIFYNISTNPKY